MWSEKSFVTMQGLGVMGQISILNQVNNFMTIMRSLLLQELLTPVITCVTMKAYICIFVH